MGIIMNKDEYISKVLSYISDKSHRYSIEQELLGHIEDNERRYIDQGYDADTSAQKALSLMGDPDTVGINLERLHSNTRYIVLSTVFLLFFLIGIIISVIFKRTFLIINLSDSYEITDDVLLFSSLIFMFSALSFYFAFKANSRRLFSLFSVAGILGWIFAPYALIGAGYSVIALFTDLPSVLFFNKGECIVGGEVYSNFIDFISNETLSLVIYYFLIILNILFGLFTLVSGIIAAKYAKQLKKAENHFMAQKSEKMLQRYSKVILVIAVISITGALCITAHESMDTYYRMKAFHSTQDADIMDALNFFEGLKTGSNENEVVLLAHKNNINEVDIKPESGVVYVYENDLCMIQLCDDDGNGIYEKKHIRIHYSSSGLSDKEVKTFLNLPDTTTVDDLLDLVPVSSISEWTVTESKKAALDEIIISSEDNSEYCRLFFKNSALVSTDDMKNYF